MASNRVGPRGGFSCTSPGILPEFYTRRFACQIALTTDEVLLSAVMGHAKNLSGGAVPNEYSYIPPETPKNQIPSKTEQIT
jgi:hypothetical protein